jgi:hypothetical protein
MPAHPALAPASNVVVRVENTKAAVEETMDSFILPIQISQQQETREVSQTDMEDQGGGADEVEVGVSMTERRTSRSYAESLNATQPTSPKRPKKLKMESRGFRNRNRCRSRLRAMLKEV